MNLKEPKVFNLQEARKTLPFVRRIVADIMQTRRDLTRTQKEIRLTKDLQHRCQKIHDLQRLQQKLEEYQRELDLVGCHIKNPDLGLVGYYWDTGKGLIVELCWRHGEKDICHWQEIGHNQLLPLEELEGV